MINTICIVIIYCLEVLNLQIISKHLLELKINFSLNKAILSTSSILVVIILDIIAEGHLCFRQFTFFTFLFALVLTSILIDEKNQILKLISISLILKIISMLLWLCGVSLELIKYDNFIYSLAFLIVNLFITLCTVITIIWAKRRKQRSLFTEYSKNELLIFISGETALIITLSIITEFSSHYSNISYVGIPLVVISIGVMVFICYNLLAMKYQNRYMKIEHDAIKKMFYLQEQYYNMLLDKEEQTKSFRHDIRNHLYSIKVLCDNSDYPQLKEYINSLIETNVYITTQINSGNKLIDAIANDLMNRFPSVKLRIFGTLDMKNKISQTDICIIISNLLSNAFEAAVQSKDKIVRIHIKSLNSNLLIIIQNSIDKVPIIINNEIKTTKSDVSHGFGLCNIRTSLARYNGVLELSCDKGLFEASVIIPDVLEIENH